MTDYLELAAGEDAGVLWEASREKGVPVFTEEDRLFGSDGLTALGEGSFPLLEALDRTDRQGSALSAAVRRNMEGMGGLYEAGGNRTRMRENGLERDSWTGTGSARTGTGRREDHLWVKQVDLAFQRDSRRYDGPFSLY